MIPASIAAKIGKGLHNKPNHPISIIKQMIYEVLSDFDTFDDLDPVVRIYDNFDALRIPEDHPSRRPSDTYYMDEALVLRTHTSAHQFELLSGMISDRSEGKPNAVKYIHPAFSKFLVTGDVYRKDDIDATHYPVFHQMEGVCITENPDEELKKVITGLIAKLFPGREFHLKSDYFPFTDPSYEVEVKFNDSWLEVLGCGVIHPEVIANARKWNSDLEGKTGWAFGLGLERLAMILFEIPDIRMFWSDDPRFLSQFKESEITKFKPFSKHPACYKDISMWIPDGFHQNSLMHVIRETAGDLVEDVKLLDQFKKDGKESRLYRLNYRALDRSLTNDEINVMQKQIRSRLTDELGVTIR